MNNNRNNTYELIKYYLIILTLVNAASCSFIFSAIIIKLIMGSLSPNCLDSEASVEALVSIYSCFHGFQIFVQCLSVRHYLHSLFFFNIDYHIPCEKGKFL